MLWNNISAFHSYSDCFYFLLDMVLVHRLLWACWFIKVLPQFFLFPPHPDCELSFPQERQRPADTCGPWARRYPTAVLGRPGRGWQDGAGKAGTYWICCFHLVQGLGQWGLVDEALVAWIISWFPAPRLTVLCAPLLPSLYQEHFQAGCAISNIYYYYRCAGYY